MKDPKDKPDIKRTVEATPVSLIKDHWGGRVIKEERSLSSAILYAIMKL